MKQEVRLIIGKRSYVAKTASIIRNITASFSSGVSVRQRACVSITITKAYGKWISAQRGKREMQGEHVLFGNKTDEWSTPDYLFEDLDKEFGFTLDPCSTDENAKCWNHYTAEQDGLQQDWGGEIVFCNPPYSDIGKWVKKCYYESLKPGTIVVLLIPARTDTKWFHEYIYHRSEVRFISGRVKFGSAKFNAPFPNMIVVFRAGGIAEKGRNK